MVVWKCNTKSHPRNSRWSNMPNSMTVIDNMSVTVSNDSYTGTTIVHCSRIAPFVSWIMDRMPPRSHTFHGDDARRDRSIPTKEELSCWAVAFGMISICLSKSKKEVRRNSKDSVPAIVTWYRRMFKNPVCLKCNDKDA